MRASSIGLSCPPLLAAAAVGALLALAAPTALAQSATEPSSGSRLSRGFKFTEKTGEALYANLCQACHMPDAEGATGAGTYPSLAGDKALATRSYPAYVIVNGQRAMPPFGGVLSDNQVAAVTNYIRTHFGNHFPDPLTPDDIKAVRR